MKLEKATQDIWLNFEKKMIKKDYNICWDRIKNIAKFVANEAELEEEEIPKRPMGFWHLGSSPFCEGDQNCL